MRNSIRDNGWFDAQLAPNARQLITLLLTILLVISSLLVQVEAADGDLREVVQHLIREFRAGPTLRDHLANAPH